MIEDFEDKNGILIAVKPADLVLVADDPGDEEARTAQLNEMAGATFKLNGIKRYRATVGGGRMILEGWGG